MEMLDEAVTAIRENRLPNFNQSDSNHAEIDLKIPAIIPEIFLRDIPLRLEFYKRISSAIDKNTLSEIEVEMIDRFGLLPPQVKNLFRQAKVRIRAEKLGIRNITIGPQSGRIEFSDKTKVDPMILISLVQSQPQQYKLDGARALKLIKKTVGADERLAWIQNVLRALDGEKS